MESTSTNLAKDARKGESTSQYAIESLESNGETLVLKKCRGKLKPRKTLILDVRRSRASASSKDFFLINSHGVHKSIPRHITTFDEKYILHCLESIRNCALRAAAWNFTSKVGNFSDDMNNLSVIKSSNNMARLAINYPLVGKTEVILNSCGDWTIGTLSGSQIMINILKSPLLKNFSSLDCDVNVRKTGLFDVSQPVDSEFMDSVQKSNSISYLQKEVKILDHKYLSEPVHKRDASTSSTNTSYSDQSPYSANGSPFQGMLQCTWKNGLPNHVFTVDEKKEVYVAKLSKVESLDGKKGLDYVYTFHSSSYGKKECDTHELALESIAKMLVSTSIKFSSNNNSEIRETRFILSVSSDNQMETSNHSVRKNKRLTKKVVDIFKSTHSHKQKSISRLGGSNSVLEDSPSDPYEEVHNNFLDLAPNLELAVIIVKDVCKNRKKNEFGGWGLKFLKRPSIETSISSECFQNNGECSTSMDVIIPAGFHGGPRTRVGGPSGLTERWVSGGVCDCGGWDIGCPLTILKSRSSGKDYSDGADNYGECKSVDLFMQGSKQNAPIMKLVNFHEGLYYIHFQSTLSSLQSFAIAAAIIHSRSPVLRSKVYRS